ncbi:MAG: DMT family transporter [Paludibacteraceae bacterium]|nr:DMT family transporter [Paludibacteraceae bacterium]
MWIVLSFISALCLGCYDISKKIALRENRVIDVLTLSVCISTVLLSVPWVLSRVCPETMTATPFYVPQLDLAAHGLVVVKSMIVLSSWVFAYISLKHLPLSVVSPMQATRPMWTLVGALLLFGERLNGWQWLGVSLAIGTVFVFSFRNKQTIRNTRHTPAGRYYVALALAILIGACSGLYDKYLMRSYDHNAVQVYYTFYQALMMLVVWFIVRALQAKKEQVSTAHPTPYTLHFTPSTFHPTSYTFHPTSYTFHPTSYTFHPIQKIGVIVLISLFLIISDNVYMLALRDPDSLIAVVSTIRRGGAVIGFAYGLLFLKEEDPWKKVACMVGILAGLICLAIGSM